MSQGGTFIQNNLDDSDEDIPVENQQTSDRQGFTAKGSNPSSRGGSDPMSVFLRELGGGVEGEQSRPLPQVQSQDVAGSKQLADMLEKLGFEQGMGNEEDGRGGGGGGIGDVVGGLSNADENLLSMLQGLKGHQGNGGSGGTAKGQISTVNGQKGQIPHSGGLKSLFQSLTGSGGAGNDESLPSLNKDHDRGRGGEANRVGGQSSGQDPIQRFVGESGGEFPNQFAVPQTFGGGGGIGQDGRQTVSGGNIPLNGLGGLGSGLTAGLSDPQSQTSQLQSMMQICGGSGQGPAGGAGNGVQGVGQTGGLNPGQYGSQGFGQVGGQGLGLNLGQAGLGGRQTSQEQLLALKQLLQRQDQGQGQGLGQIPQGEGLGLAQASLARGQIPEGQQMQNQGQMQGLNSVGRNFGGLGSIGRGLGPMGRGLGGIGSLGGSLGGLGPVGRGSLPGQIPGRGRGEMEATTTDLIQLELARALQNPDSRAAGPCTVIIVDCSGSVQGQPLQDAVHFVSEFIDGLEEVQFENELEENIALITVGANMVNISQHLTNNYQKVRDIVNSFHAEGPTHLEMAFLMVLAALANSEKAIYNTNQHYVLPRVIVLTDGRPTKDADIPGQVINPEDQNLLMMKNFTTECAHMINEKTLARIICVPIGECDVNFLEMLAGVTGGHVRCLGDAHPLSRNFLHHFIAGKMKAAGVKSDDLASVLKAAEELTVADDADVESILNIIKEDEPNIAEWKSKQQESPAVPMGGMGNGVPRLPGGMGMGGSGQLHAGMGGPNMAALFGQGMGGAGMGGPGIADAGMAAMMSQAMGGAGMGRGGAGLGGGGMPALMNHAMAGTGMGGAGMGGFPGLAGLPGMGGFPALYGMGGGQQRRKISGFLRD